MKIESGLVFTKTKHEAPKSRKRAKGYTQVQGQAQFDISETEVARAILRRALLTITPIELALIGRYCEKLLKVTADNEQVIQQELERALLEEATTNLWCSRAEHMKARLEAYEGKGIQWHDVAERESRGSAKRKKESCSTCLGGKVIMSATGNPKKPLKVVPCPSCVKPTKEIEA